MVEKTSSDWLAAAKSGNSSAFRELVEPIERELGAYAYRMLGGFQDAEDALQEAELKAWRALAAYEPRASFRTWMYEIVTNTCLDMLRTRKRRVLPSDVGPPVEPGPPLTEMRSDIAWLEPYPNSLLPSVSDPETQLRVHESIRLAFIRAVQVLPPRQRASLILHDVLDFPVSEVATMLETSVPAVNSALQRARATVKNPESDPAARTRLEKTKSEAVLRYIEAWETGNVDAFASMLAEDAVMSMPPWVYWLEGRAAVNAALRSPATWEGEPRPGRYRLVRTEMNGDPAAIAYLQDKDGRYTPSCMTVLSFDGEGRVSDLTIFVLVQYLEKWGYPTSLELG